MSEQEKAFQLNFQTAVFPVQESLYLPVPFVELASEREITLGKLAAYGLQTPVESPELRQRIAAALNYLEEQEAEEVTIPVIGPYRGQFFLKLPEPRGQE